jgi:Tfp pilus assembly protein PilN
VNAVNLIPKDAAKTGQSRVASAGSGAHVLLGILAVAVLMAGAWAMTGKDLDGKRSELARVQSAAVAAEATVGELTTYKDFAARSTSREETVRGLIDGRFDWSHGLREVARVIPADVDLTSLVGTTSPTSSVQGAGGSGSLRGALAAPAIDLIGCAKSQSRVAQLLARLRAIDGVQRVSLSSSEKSENSSLSATDCRASAQMPQFQLTVFFDSLPGIVPSVAATTAPASTAASTTSAGGTK